MINALFESASRNVITITAQQNRVIFESAELLSELNDNALTIVLAESDLSPSDAARIFKAAVSLRSEKGLVTKAKDAYVISAEKIGAISVSVKSKLSSLIAASEPATTKLINMIRSGGPTATNAIDMIDSKIDAQVLTTKASARLLPRSFNRVLREINDIEKIAKGAPQYGAFAVASLASATEMMQRNIAVPSIVLYLSTVAEVMKGKKLSSALRTTINDLGPAETASVNEADIDYYVDESRIRELSGVPVNEKFGLGDKTPLDYDELLTAWSRKGRPTAIGEIKAILVNAGMSNREISKAFKSADVDDEAGTDFKVTRFAAAIKKVDLTAYVVDYLESMHPKEIKESVQLDEAEISDADIKKVLLRVSRASNSTDLSQNKSVRRYLKKWYNEFAIITDPAQKQLVAGEAVSYLHDRQSYAEYNDAVNTVTKAIRNSDLDDKVKKDLLADISNRRLYKPRETVVPDMAVPSNKKPRAQIRSKDGEKTRVRPTNAVESMTLEDLQKLFEDAIVRDMEYRYGRTRREAL
jgi:hypothetical protein